MKFAYILLVPILMIAHGGEKHDEKKVNVKKVEVKKSDIDIYSKINREYIKNIKPIFQVKCFNCHNDETKQYWYSNLPLVSSMIESDIKEAKKHLDFSKDFPFISHETPYNDLITILDVFEKGTMPPFRYEIMHSESKITQNDVEKVKRWVEQSLDMLNKKD